MRTLRTAKICLGHRQVARWLKQQRALTLTLIAGLAAACGPGVDVGLGQSSDAIINGESCSEEEQPTTVAILVDATISFGGFGEQPIKTVVCTGTLIAPDVVLTAAHCLDASALAFGFGEVLEENYFITFEDDLVYLANPEGQGQSIPEFPADAIGSVDFLPHPDFALESLNAQTVNGPGDFKDIGLIFLEEEVQDVVPELVITEDEADQLVDGLEVVIAGWGQQVPTSGPFEAPPAGSVGQKVCATSFINEMGNMEFQVGGDNTTSRKCRGDSGGPSFAVLDTPFDNDRRVVGVTSHAYDAEECNKGGVDTRVDVWLDWIDDEMVARCDDNTRAWCDVDGIIPPSFYEGPVGGEGEGEGEDPKVGPNNEVVGGCSSTSVGGSSALPALLGLGLLAVALRRRRR